MEDHWMLRHSGLLYSDIDLSAVSSEDPNRIGDFFFNTPQLAAEKHNTQKNRNLVE